MQSKVSVFIQFLFVVDTVARPYYRSRVVLVSIASTWCLTVYPVSPLVAKRRELKNCDVSYQSSICFFESFCHSALPILKKFFNPPRLCIRALATKINHLQAEICKKLLTNNYKIKEQEMIWKFLQFWYIRWDNFYRMKKIWIQDS